MARFRRLRSLQKFASVHASVSNHFNQNRRLSKHDHFNANLAAALAAWCVVSARSDANDVKQTETSSN